MANPKARIWKPGDVIDYTNTSTLLSGGTPTQLSDGIVGIPPSDIAATTGKGVLQVEGIIAIEATTSVGNVGDNVWYDENGSPYGGTASSGAASTDATVGDYWIGTLAAAKGATDKLAYVRLNKVNPALPPWINKTHIKTAIDLTWAAATHNGMVIHVTADAKTLTMPVGVAGMECILQNDVADAGSKLVLDFNGNETLEGNLAIAATKTADLTKLTSIRGDYIHIRCETAASLWVCLAIRGTWVTSA